MTLPLYYLGNRYLRNKLISYATSMISVIQLLFFALILSSCLYDDLSPTRFPAGEVTGYKPVYADNQQLEISFNKDQPLKNPGKIYRFGHYLLINERYKGVHVVDNLDAKNPVLLGFLTISGNVDMAMKGNLLIVDHLTDLVTIDITDITKPIVIDRVENVYNISSALPPEGGYFQCVDPLYAHLITSWELTTLTNPSCFQ